MKVKEMSAEIAHGIVNAYEKRRDQGMEHHQAWLESVGLAHQAWDQIDMLAQMEAAEMLGKKYDLKTGERK